MPETVVVFHGIMQPALAMRPLCAHLRSEGFDARNVDYPSTRHRIEDLADIVMPRVREASRSGERVHFVGFSMGGLIARTVIKRERPANLGRVVTIGTPNHGSELAEALRDFSAFKKFYGPAGQQLGTRNRDVEAVLAQGGFEIGTIAGRVSFNPVAAAIFHAPSDGKVSVESAHVPWESDHALVFSSHKMLPFNRRVWRMTVNFLSDGAFAPERAARRAA